MIIKAVGGLYWINENNKLIRCSAKGILRQKEISPMVGDMAFFDVESSSNIDNNDTEKGVIISIAQRKNYLIRPCVSNIDNLFIVSSTDKPIPNLLILDKLFAIAEYHDIKANLIVTKTDLKSSDFLESIYTNAGFDVFCVCAPSGEGIDSLKKTINGKINVFIGNTGVGKSSVLNAIEDGLALKTAHISEKLGRGRHTTRHSELYPLKSGGFIADTPGFSTVDVSMYGIDKKENLQFCFKEFIDYIGECKYTGCSHTTEANCKILHMIEQEKISQSRHKSYVTIYNELKLIKSWDSK